MTGDPYTAEALVEKALRYCEYFGAEGGVTVSGGEPLLQAAFAREIFALCRERGVHTCLDTSGCLMNADVEALLEVADRVLLDIKYTTDEQYRAYAGCGMDKPLAFLTRLEERGIATTLRQVIIPTLNDTEENILALREIAAGHSVVDGVELLPFRKICQVKYDKLGLVFPFAHLPEPTAEKVKILQKLCDEGR